MLFRVAVVCIYCMLLGCAPSIPPYTWGPVPQNQEAEYAPYMKEGAGSVAGQAFLNQRGGATVKASGRIVTLDPATSLGREWWIRPVVYRHEYFDVPPSPVFLAARRHTVADADGRFRFEGLPDGKYFVQTSVTWEVGRGRAAVQGGLVGQEVEVVDGGAVDVILGPRAWRTDLSGLRVYYSQQGPLWESVDPPLPGTKNNK